MANGPQNTSLGSGANHGNCNGPSVVSSLQSTDNIQNEANAMFQAVCTSLSYSNF